LQQEVAVNLTTLNENIQGYLVNSQGDDVRKVLLINGFAKLSKDSINGITTKEFMELKQVAQNALEGGKGLWKEQKVIKS
jgi:predicted peroxiredoxin